MPSSLFKNNLTPNNSLLGVLGMLKSGNPNMIFQNMLNTNPQFRNFIEQNKGKSPEQIASENGIDLNSLKSLFR